MITTGILLFTILAFGIANPCPSATFIVNDLFENSLNLSYPGLEAAQKAWAAKNQTAACFAVENYYKTSKTGWWWRKNNVPKGSGHAGGAADAALSDVYTFYTVTAKVPRFGNGDLDWEYEGPNNDDEFMFALNRLAIFGSLVDAWQETGNWEYVELYQNLSVDWAANNPAPSKPSGVNDTWRTLEAGIRMDGSLEEGFFGFLDAEDVLGNGYIVSGASVAGAHGRYLAEYANEGNPNWKSMQYSGLAAAAIAFPEMRDSNQWYAQAAASVETDMEGGVYPDGVETEETSHYHEVATDNFNQFVNLSMLGGRTPPAQVTETVERMFSYLAYSIDPAGYGALNGDSDLDYNTDVVLGAAAQFNRSDWVYIATHGKSGTEPSTPPSAMFPYAGQLISRSGWGEDDEWSFFDVGPFGSSSHGHRDKLHLSVRRGDQLLLCDSGRFAYSGNLSVFRNDYAIQSTGHNVLLLDGKQQVDTPATVSTPLINGTDYSINTTHDFAGASQIFDGISGTAKHHRSLLYIRNDVWIVVDRVETSQPRTAEWLWHVHPNCSADLEPSSLIVQGQNNGPKLTLSQAQDSSIPSWSNATIIQGQTSPIIQGWFSRVYDVYQSSPVASYTATIPAGNTTVAWIIETTSSSQQPAPTAKIIQSSPNSVTLSYKSSKSSATVTIPLR